MAVKNKIWYAEQVLNELNPELRNRDEKIDPREVMIRIDAIVNNMAKLGVFESWNLGERSVDDQFITTWDGISSSWINITDPSSGESYFTIPANYVALPKNMGIVQVFLEREYFDPIAIISKHEVPTLRSTMSRSLQERIAVYPAGGKIFFYGRKDIATKHGRAGIQLVIRDSSMIADDAPYPIDASMEQAVIEEAVKWFRMRKVQGQDTVRDNVDDSTIK